MSDERTTHEVGSNGDGDPATIDPAAVDTSAVDPEEFARNISKASDDDLRQAMSSPLRPTILREIFSRMEAHFRSEQAGDVEAVIHWRIGGGPNDSENHFEVVVRAGALTYTDEPAEEPRVTFKMDGATFLKLVTGNASGPMLFMTGKLKIEGDMMFAPQVQSLFKIPG
ncbi:MAG TPA: SCP2 sterol-binding domain-containing protein [Solirubrobacterales bacterium]